MNQKARHIGKRKAGSSARKRLRKLHTSEYENSCFTKNFCTLFQRISNRFKEVTINSAILGANSTSSFLKKKKNLKKEKGKGKEKKRERKREGKGEGKGEERRDGERREEKRGKNGESGTKSSF